MTRDYAPYPTGCLFPIPDSLSYVGAVLLEPLGLALRTVSRRKPKADVTITAFGYGPVGLLILSGSKVHGRRHYFGYGKTSTTGTGSKNIQGDEIFLVRGSHQLD